jgi:dolichol-phosphate mannosyltransferase
MQRERAALGRMVRFGIVGASGIVVNQGLLMLLHGTFGLPLLPSSVFAIETSILSNFVLNSRWTWKVDLGRSPRNWVQKAVQYHAATVLSAFAGNVLILMGLVHLFGIDYRLANLVGIAVGSGVNYLAGEFWVFRKTPRHVR